MIQEDNEEVSEQAESAVVSHRAVAIGTALFVVAIAFGGYRWWGASMDARYERHVQALRDSGEFVDEPDPLPEIPASENAAGLLTEAADLLVRLEEDPEFGGSLLWFIAEPDGPYEAYELEALQTAWPLLEDYFALLEKARERPVFVPPPLDHDGPHLFCDTSQVCDLLQLKARLYPETAAGAISLLLDLADKWRPSGTAQLIGRNNVRSAAVEILHRTLAEGTFESGTAPSAWNRADIEESVLPEFATFLRRERAESILTIEKIRAGLDPWRELRKDWPSSLVGELPEVPGWYERPLFLRDALESLDRARYGIERATTERSLRDTLAMEHGGEGKRMRGRDFFLYVNALKNLADLRLARIAMAIQTDATRRDSARDSLEAYAAALGGAVPQNPFTGQPFGFERHDDRVVLTCALVAGGAEGPETLRAAIAQKLYHEDRLLWIIRWAPTKTKG